MPSTILLPTGFGLLGFVEPCSLGATILFLGPVGAVAALVAQPLARAEAGYSFALSTPPVAIAALPKAEGFLRRAQAWAGRVPGLVGIVSIDLGALPLLVAWGQMRVG